MPGGSPSPSILAAAGQGGPPGGGAPGGGPPGCGGRGGGKGTTSFSGRSFHGLVQPEFGTGGVQHSAAGTSQTQMQQTNIYSGTSQQRHQRRAELARQCMGTSTFPLTHPTHLCLQHMQHNIQPIDIPRACGLPIRGSLSNLGIMLKVHGIKSLELTPILPPEQVKRMPMKSQMAPVPQMSSTVKRSRDDSDSSEDSSFDVDTPDLHLHNLKANVKVLEA